MTKRIAKIAVILGSVILIVIALILGSAKLMGY